MTASSGRLRIADGRRSAFTLVELLAIITIIGILSTIFIGALYQADQVSKVARTRSQIQKMSNMLMARWDGYRNVRLPLSADTLTLANGTDTGGFRSKVALRRVLALRELVRMEIPDRYDDLTFTPVVLPQPSFLRQAYWRKMGVSNLTAATTKAADCKLRYESAEMLYLVLTTGIDDSSLGSEHFMVGETADIDRDGMREFIDAWGNPIEFLRWAPGFESPMQPYYRYPNAAPFSSLFNPTSANALLDPEDSSQIRSRFNVRQNPLDPNQVFVVEVSDPFNPMRVGTTLDTNGRVARIWQPGDPTPENGFYLAPLIYSNGPDYRGGIDRCAGTVITPDEYRDFRDLDYQLSESIAGTSPSAGCGYPGAEKSDPYNRYTNGTLTRWRGASTNEGFNFDNVHNQQTAAP
jgi:type II secretory pathway pseudopilin PulG